MRNWNEIKNMVEENNNVLTISMTELKEAAGKDKLGVNVRAEISKTLAGMGLGHIPQEIPSYQHEFIRLYKRGTSVGELIETVILPGEQNDRKLRDQLNNGAPDYLQIIEKIRELVTE